MRAPAPSDISYISDCERRYAMFWPISSQNRILHSTATTVLRPRASGAVRCRGKSILRRVTFGTVWRKIFGLGSWVRLLRVRTPALGTGTDRPGNSSKLPSARQAVTSSWRWVCRRSKVATDLERDKPSEGQAAVFSALPARDAPLQCVSSGETSVRAL